MSGKFTHYLVTRFNVNINGHGPEYIQRDVPNRQWEKERLPLFESICVPSVAGQTCHDFTWLIYADANSDESTLERMKTAIDGIPKAEIILVSGFTDLVHHLQAKCAHSLSPYVITSRLDNDDAVGKQYVETIQNHFIPEDLVVINLLGGVNYHLTKKLLTLLRYKENNHFISLIERVNVATTPVTIMGFSHLHPRESMVVKNIPLKYAFWITLHDQNAAPRNNRGWPVFYAGIAKRYSIDPGKTPVSWRNTILYTLRWMPEAIVRKVRFKSKHMIQRNKTRG